mgnify:CR=1 FL=1
MKKKLPAILSTLLFISVAYIYLTNTYYFISKDDQVRRVVVDAENKNDPSLCRKIKVLVPSPGGPDEISLENSCFAEVARDMGKPEMCTQYISYRVQQNYCLKGVALAAGKVEICKLIPEDDFINASCYSEFERIHGATR